MKELTINDLLRLCKQQVKLGNGHKKVAMTSDDEANEYHSAWFGLTDGRLIKQYVGVSQTIHLTSGIEDYVVLG